MGQNRNGTTEEMGREERERWNTEKEGDETEREERRRLKETVWNGRNSNS